MTELPRLYRVLSAVAAVILLHQLLDLLLQLPDIDFATPAGRTRQLLATAARSPALLTADALAIWALLLAGRHGALRTLGSAHLVVGALFLLALPMFIMDAGRLASSFGGPSATAFRVVSIRTMLLLPALGVGAILAGRALRSAEWQSGRAADGQ